MAIIFGEKLSYDKIYDTMYNLLFVPSGVYRKCLVNRNNLRSFHEEIVKNTLKTKKMQ